MKKNKILPLRLKIAREEKGLTQEQVAEKLSISIGTISGYERGHRSPNPEMIEGLADLYDKSVDWLLGRNPFPSELLKENDIELLTLFDEYERKGISRERMKQIIKDVVAIGEAAIKEKRKSK